MARESPSDPRAFVATVASRGDEPVVAAPTTSGWGAAVAGVVLLGSIAWAPIGDRILRAAAPRTDEDVPVGWGFVDVGAVILLFVLGSLGIGAGARLLGFDLDDASTLLVISALTQGFAVLAVLVIATRTGLDGLRALGVRAGGAWSPPFASLFVYATMLPAFASVGYLWRMLLEAAGRVDVEQRIVQEFARLAPGERAFPLVLGVLVVPLFEETLFRGFLQPVLVRRFRVAGGVALTSAVFAILHGVEAFLPIFVLSCLLGLVVVRTRRLHAAWMVHAAHNGLQFLLLYNVPELARP